MCYFVFSFFHLLIYSANTGQNCSIFSIYLGGSFLRSTLNVNSADRKWLRCFFIIWVFVCVCDIIFQSVHDLCSRTVSCFFVWKYSCFCMQSCICVCVSLRERVRENVCVKRVRCQVYPLIDPTWEWSSLSRGSQIYLHVVCACVHACVCVKPRNDSQTIWKPDAG